MTSSWVEESIELANHREYLDRLYEVYPLDIGGAREVKGELLNKIQSAHRRKNGRELVEALMEVERFPIPYPYATLLRLDSGLSTLNPETVCRIARPLLAMDVQSLLSRCMDAKPANTQIGPMFQNYVKTLGFPFVDEVEFIDAEGTVFLEGSDKDLQEFANQELECSLRKGPDVLFKIGGDYFLGEAKFFSSGGGNQNKGFDEALDFLGAHRGNAERFVVLDGAVWLKSQNQKMQREVKKVTAPAFSALLFKKYIRKMG